MATFRLGTLSSLLSNPLVNGFTTGAAFHVITSQLKEVIGVSVPRPKGAFKIIKTVIDLINASPSTNYAALGFCLCIIVFMTICNECVKPFLRKHCRFPLPAELMAIIGGTLIAKATKLNEHYKINSVGEIPSGLPIPTVPRLDLVPMMLIDSIPIAIVSYSIIMSMGITISRKHHYDVRANQELLAVGVGNVVGGFFSCIPMACSLSRSIIQDQAGGNTQIASLISALLIIATLLWIGPFFGELPRCVLAGVIIVALKPLFMQIKDFRKFARQGKLECLTWNFTFFGVVFIDIDFGLLIGVALSLLALYIKGFKPYSSMLGTVPSAMGIYVDLEQHNNAIEVPQIKIFRYYSALNFATGSSFRRALFAKLFLEQDNQNNTVQHRQNLCASPTEIEVLVDESTRNISMNTVTLKNFQVNFIIIDMTMLGHVDYAGCVTMSDIMNDMKNRNIRVLLASPADGVYNTLVHSMALGEGPFEIYPTLHDAVSYARSFR